MTTVRCTCKQAITILPLYSNVINDRLSSVFGVGLHIKMAAAVYIFALFLFLPLAKMKSVDDYLQSVLQSIDKLIDFYQSDFQDLNVDGLFGLRVLEGNIVIYFRDIWNRHKFSGKTTF